MTMSVAFLIGSAGQSSDHVPVLGAILGEPGGSGGSHFQHVWTPYAHERWASCQQLHPAGTTE